MPAASMAFTQASSASDAWVTSPALRVKPVVAADANATLSLTGLRVAMVMVCSSALVRQAEHRVGAPVPLGPVQPHPLAHGDVVGRRVDHRRGEAQALLLVELDGGDRAR